MSTIVKEIVVPDDRNVNIQLPADVPVGKAVVTVTVEPKTESPKRPNRLSEVCGLEKGKVWMADDFDAPLEDFKDYM